jgi:hypothetical protein
VQFDTAAFAPMAIISFTGAALFLNHSGEPVDSLSLQD